MSHFEVNLRSFQNKALFDACNEKKRAGVKSFFFVLFQKANVKESFSCGTQLRSFAFC